MMDATEPFLLTLQCEVCQAIVVIPLQPNETVTPQCQCGSRRFTVKHIGKVKGDA